MVLQEDGNDLAHDRRRPDNAPGQDERKLRLYSPESAGRTRNPMPLQVKDVIR
jgi:hypothetical protein